MTAHAFRHLRILCLSGLFIAVFLACGNSAEPPVEKDLDALPEPVESELRKQDWSALDTITEDSANLFIRPLTDQD